MPRTYYSKATVGPRSAGWLVAWMSNQLTEPWPQWPRLRVVEGQELSVAIDPRGAPFGLKCSATPDTVQICAVIDPDEQSNDRRAEYLLPFPPFTYATP
jgi:hypothetical protein